MENSKFLKLNKQDLLKIAKGAGYAMGGAMCTYLLTIIGNIDFGTQTPLVVALASILLNAGVKFFSGSKE